MTSTDIMRVHISTDFRNHNSIPGWKILDANVDWPKLRWAEIDALGEVALRVYHPLLSWRRSVRATHCQCPAWVNVTVDDQAVVQSRQSLNPWCVAPLLGFPDKFDVMSQYRVCHHLPDLFGFMEAVAGRFDSDTTACDLLENTFMIPEPWFGTIQTSLLFDILDEIDDVLMRCMSLGLHVRMAARPGDLGYLVERLHSHLLLLGLQKQALLNDPSIWGVRQTLGASAH